MISNYFSIVAILVIVTFLSYLSQKRTLSYEMSNTQKDWRKHIDIYMLFLIIFLILFAGLRTSYNDTGTYISGFNMSENIFEFLNNPDNLHLTANPLFYGFQALVRTFTNNANVFFIVLAMFIQTRLIVFIKRNVEADNFAMTMFLYCCLGCLTLSISAQKQILAMAILTFAIEFLIEKKYLRFCLIVFISGLIHTYAWLFIILPIINTKLWNWQIYILLMFTIIIMYTFQNSINSFLEVADMIGKNIPIEEVLSSSSMNVYRVLVYGIVPILSFFFKKELQNGLDKTNIIFIHMTIINFLFMLLGMINGANMFGRAGRYFEFGYICVLPIIIKVLFNKQSAKIVLSFTIVLFIVFFLYDNQSFYKEYQFKPLVQFIGEIL